MEPLKMDMSTEGRLVRLETRQEIILARLTSQDQKLDEILTLMAYVRGGAWVLLGLGGVLGTIASWFTPLRKLLFG